MASARMVDALLLDAQHQQTLTSARSLHRAGLSVSVAAPAWEASRAPGMHSRYARARICLPAVEENGDAFTNALLRHLDINGAAVVIAAHDGTIEAIRARRTEFERRTRLALAGDNAISIAASKSRTLALARDLGIATPRTTTLASSDDAATAVRAIGLPVVVKPARSWVQRNGVGTRVTSSLGRSLAEVQQAVDWITSRGGEVLLQQWLPGWRDAVTMVRVGDAVRARFAQRSYREFPALGGVSVLCEGLPLLHDITAPAERLVAAMGLDGPSMVEFRRDSSDHPILMEVNARMGGSVALAVRSGVDIPLLTFLWASGQDVPAVNAYAVGRRVRWLAGDIWNLKTSFDSPGHPDVPSPSRAIGRFLVDFARRPAALEPFNLRDPIPALVELRYSVMGPVRERINRYATRAMSRRPKVVSQ